MRLREKRVIYIVGGFAAITLIAGIWLLYNYIRGVTAGEVDSIFKTHIAIGSSRAEVSAFIDSLKIDPLKVDNFGYRDDLAHMSYGPFDDKDKQLKGTVRGYLNARIQNTSRSLWLSQCDMEVRFYFDINERLIDYQILETFE